MIALQDRVAIVTGAGAGIGREIALLLARRGARVLVNDYGGDCRGNPGDPERAEALAREIAATGGTAVANSVAVGGADAAQAIRDAALDAFGRVDILVNNAGVTLPGAFATVTRAEIERVVAIDFWGPYHLMRSVWPGMAERGYGRIVNFTSNALMGGYGGYASYASAKAAVLGLTTDAGTEGKPLGILVNAVMPLAFTRLAGADAVTITDEFARWIEHYFHPRQIAPVVAYLASAEATASGEIFCVGGGRVSRLAFVDGAGFVDPDLSPESIAENIDAIRNLSRAVILERGPDELQRYMNLFPFPVRDSEEQPP